MGEKYEVRGRHGGMVDAGLHKAELAQASGGPFAFVAAVVGSGASGGLSVIAATVLGVDWLRTEAGPANLDSSFYLLVGGTLAGILLAAYVAWRLLAPVGSAYRRGALSIVCSFATVLLMLICIPIHQLLGRVGLLVLLVVSATAAGFLAYQAKRQGAGR